MSRIILLIIIFLIIIIKNNIVLDTFTINCQKFPYLCSEKKYQTNQAKYIQDNDTPDTRYWASKS